MKTNILIVTLGGSWQVIPEIVGFTNPDDLPLYRHSPWQAALQSLRQEHHLPCVDEVWAATTNGRQAREARRELALWQSRLSQPTLRVWWPEDLADIRSAEAVKRMADLLYRLTLLAHERTNGGAVLLSLAGGRKTMSADLQRAGEIFGCRAMLHVIDRSGKPPRLSPVELSQPLTGEAAQAFMPIVVTAGLPGSEAVRLHRDRLRPLAAALPESGAVPAACLDGGLVDEVTRLQRQADALLVNYRLELSRNETLGNFRALYALPPRQIDRLRTETIGRDPHRRQAELDWLRRLPKAELHCHLGGLLNPGEMIDAADAEADRVTQWRHRRPDFATDLARLEAMVRHDALDEVSAFLGPVGFKGLRRRWRGIPEPLGVCAFLLAFREREDLLTRLIYGELTALTRFHGIGIERYERLGDLQGSGLLQSEAVLRRVMDCLARQCDTHHIRYLELRCSPLNYTRGGLSATQVVNLLLDAIERIGHCDIRLLFIASRHRDPGQALEHVRLADKLLAEDERFAWRFVGFDLAGAEHVARPNTFRQAFRPLHERVIRITIHAGENEPVRNIWEAVYDLNADRIGHGLTLRDDPGLLERFRDHRIGVEMCPSSNFQIVGFRDHLLATGPETPYPLADYLRRGLRVTVNTDDPGISLTDLSREYHKAAAMSADGLSRWQVLQLVRNGFRAAFCGYADRRRMLLQTEAAILRQLTAEMA